MSSKLKKVLKHSLSAKTQLSALAEPRNWGSWGRDGGMGRPMRPVDAGREVETEVMISLMVQRGN